MDDDDDDDADDDDERRMKTRSVQRWLSNGDLMTATAGEGHLGGEGGVEDEEATLRRVGSLSDLVRRYRKQPKEGGAGDVGNARGRGEGGGGNNNNNNSNSAAMASNKRGVSGGKGGGGGGGGGGGSGGELAAFPAAREMAGRKSIVLSSGRKTGKSRWPRWRNIVGRNHSDPGEALFDDVYLRSSIHCSFVHYSFKNPFHILTN